MRHQRKVREMIPCVVRTVIMLVVFGLVWGNPALALVGAQEVAAADGPQILWKVESSQNSIYLAGSIHVLQKDHYPLHQAFDDAFNESSRVMFEVDLDGLSSPPAQMNMLRKGLYLNGESLQNVLSPESYAIAKGNLTKLGLNIEDFHRMKPWMMAIAVMALELQNSDLKVPMVWIVISLRKLKRPGRAFKDWRRWSFNSISLISYLHQCKSNFSCKH